jgi:hypothetical protein
LSTSEVEDEDENALKRKRGFGPGNVDEALGRSLLSSGWWWFVWGRVSSGERVWILFYFSQQSRRGGRAREKVGAETGGPTATVEGKGGWKAVDGG